jgi:hypothetical protein
LFSNTLNIVSFIFLPFKKVSLSGVCFAYFGLSYWVRYFQIAVPIGFPKAQIYCCYTSRNVYLFNDVYVIQVCYQLLFFPAVFKICIFIVWKRQVIYFLMLNHSSDYLQKVKFVNCNDILGAWSTSSELKAKYFERKFRVKKALTAQIKMTVLCQGISSNGGFSMLPTSFDSVNKCEWSWMNFPCYWRSRHAHALWQVQLT